MPEVKKWKNVQYLSLSWYEPNVAKFTFFVAEGKPEEERVEFQRLELHSVEGVYYEPERLVHVFFKYPYPSCTLDEKGVLTCKSEGGA